MGGIKKHDTASQLRLLANALDRGDDVPDFVFCFVKGDEFFSTHRAEKNVFGLLGLAEYRKDLIRREIE